MASSATVSETSPLLSARSPKPPRTVTFNPKVATQGPSENNASTSRPSIAPTASGQPALTAINSRLKRRHSHGSALTPNLASFPKPGAQRTTKHASKLKLLPDPEHGEDGPDEESGRDVYSQFTRIKDPTARRDAARLGKDDREKLPRVTAYCTANAYRLDDLMKYLRSRRKVRGTAPKQFDECIYSPFRYPRDRQPSLDNPDGLRGASPRASMVRRFSDSAVEAEEDVEQRHEDLADIRKIRNEEGPVDEVLENADPIGKLPDPDFDTDVHTPEVFLFDYGTVVIWGMNRQEEERFMKDIAKFETEKLGEDDVQVENFNFYYTTHYQPRIYNDFISLRDKKNYMTKLAISHALSQSVKTSLYEDLVDNTIDTTKEIPTQLAETGKTGMSRREIAMSIGELFILRINIHLQGSVLDSPELMWAEPGLEPIYTAARSYLELDPRCQLLQERLDVIADLLAVLKDQSAHRHGEFLEWIVIILIAAEIIVAAINIVVDLVAGVE